MSQKICQPASSANTTVRPSREVWDEALLRSGLDPNKVTAYNVREEGTKEQPSDLSKKCLNDK